MGADRGEFGREAQQMSDLQHQAPRLCQRVQRIGLGEGFSDRLFHQHVAASAQGGVGQIEMRRRRGSDHDGLAGGQQVRPGQRRAAHLLRAFCGAGRVGIIDSGQPGPRVGGHLLGMEASEMAATGHADGNLVWVLWHDIALHGCQT